MTFVDVESMVLQFLNTETGVPVHTTVPADRPARFIRMWRNGGAAINRVVDRAQVTVEAWSGDSVDAAELAGTCRELLLAASGALPLVRRVEEVTGPYPISDDLTETPRYRFTVALTVRAKRS